MCVRSGVSNGSAVHLISVLFVPTEAYMSLAHILTFVRYGVLHCGLFTMIPNILINLDGFSHVVSW